MSMSSARFSKAASWWRQLTWKGFSVNLRLVPRGFTDADQGRQTWSSGLLRSALRRGWRGTVVIGHCACVV
jgi:hypothetical protein